MGYKYFVKTISHYKYIVNVQNLGQKDIWFVVIGVVQIFNIDNWYHNDCVNMEITQAEKLK